MPLNKKIAVQSFENTTNCMAQELDCLSRELPIFFSLPGLFSEEREKKALRAIAEVVSSGVLTARFLGFRGRHGADAEFVPIQVSCLFGGDFERVDEIIGIAGDPN